MKHLRAHAPWLVVTVVLFAGAFIHQRLTTPPAPAQLLSWQRAVSTLTPEQQQTWREIRSALAVVELERARRGEWPPSLLTPGAAWSHARAQLAINYVAEANGLRWLVLYLEPDPRVTEPPPPDDDEHHTLDDGTALHVTVWSQPLTAPPPRAVTAFPAAEGWVELVRRP